LALADAKRRLPSVPFILLTCALGKDENQISKILSDGAKACVLKDDLDPCHPQYIKLWDKE